MTVAQAAPVRLSSDVSERSFRCVRGPHQPFCLRDGRRARHSVAGPRARRAACPRRSLFTTSTTRDTTSPPPTDPGLSLARPCTPDLPPPPSPPPLRSTGERLRHRLHLTQILCKFFRYCRFVCKTGLGY